MRKLISLFALALMLTTTQASEFSNQNCVHVFRDGSLDLMELVEDYNSSRLNRGDFYREAMALGASIKTLRAGCFVAESPEVKSCVESYKEIYQDLRGRVRLTAVLLGNQNKVKLPFAYKARMLGKVGIQDVRCSNF